jgi:hypothetical protein
MKDEKVRVVLERPDNDLGMDATKTAIVVGILAPTGCECHSHQSVGQNGDGVAIVGVVDYRDQVIISLNK